MFTLNCLKSLLSFRSPITCDFLIIPDSQSCQGFMHEMLQVFLFTISLHVDWVHSIQSSAESFQSLNWMNWCLQSYLGLYKFTNSCAFQGSFGEFTFWVEKCSLDLKSVSIGILDSSTLLKVNEWRIFITRFLEAVKTKAIDDLGNCVLAKRV